LNDVIRASFFVAVAKSSRHFATPGLHVTDSSAQCDLAALDSATKKPTSFYHIGAPAVFVSHRSISTNLGTLSDFTVGSTASLYLTVSRDSSKMGLLPSK
jgi:hypothetical protein